jgi:hypothetical protein
VVTNTREPVTIIAGDTISFTKSLADFPASQGWSLKYTLRGGANPIEFTSTADGDDHVLSVDALTTAQWLPQDYTFSGFAEKGSERDSIYLATLTVIANTESSDATQQTTHAQRMIERLESVLEGKARSDILDSEVEGTVIRRMPFADVFKLLQKYRRMRESEIAAERIRNGQSSGRKIVTRLNVMQGGNFTTVTRP